MFFIKNEKKEIITDYMSKYTSSIIYYILSTYNNNCSFYYDYNKNIINKLTEEDAYLKINKILKKCNKKRNLYDKLLIRHIKSRLNDKVDFLPIILALCVNNNLKKIWDLFTSNIIFKYYMKNLGNRYLNEYYNKKDYQTKHLKRILYYDMFQYIDFKNFDDNMINFMDEKKVFNVFKNNDLGLIGIIDFLLSVNDYEFLIKYNYNNRRNNNIIYRKLIKYNCLYSTFRKCYSNNLSDDILEQHENIINNFFIFIQKMNEINVIKDVDLNLNDYFNESILFKKNYINRINIIKSIYNNFSSKLVYNIFDIKYEINNFINDKKQKFVNIKNIDKYYHNKICPITLEEFIDDDDIYIYDCNHYIRITKESIDSLTNMYSIQKKIFCPNCRYVDIYYNSPPSSPSYPSSPLIYSSSSI